MDWILRPATRWDARRLACIGSATFIETFAGILDGDAILDHCEKANSAATYLEYLDSGARSWLAEANPGSAPVAFSLLTSSSLPGTADDGSDVELKRIYVLSRFHGSGIGAALMRAATEASRDMGARRMLLGVYAGNERAQAFYRKQGFVQVASRRFTVGSRDYDDNVLALALD